MRSEPDDNEALVAFLKALATTLVWMDDWDPNLRNSANFIRVLDDGLKELQDLPEIDGPALYERVQVLRRNLDVALDKARLAFSEVAGSG